MLIGIVIACGILVSIITFAAGRWIFPALPDVEDLTDKQLYRLIGRAQDELALRIDEDEDPRDESHLPGPGLHEPGTPRHAELRPPLVPGPESDPLGSVVVLEPRGGRREPAAHGGHNEGSAVHDPAPWEPDGELARQARREPPASRFLAIAAGHLTEYDRACLNLACGPLRAAA